MLLGLVTQLRNEMDIAKTFIEHIDALFDRVYLVDHQSVDGTSELLKHVVSQRPGWKYYSLDVKTKVQRPVANLLLHEAFSDGVDFLFFLDADEFIEVSSRDDLERRLAGWVDHSTVGSLKWKNCVSHHFSDKEFTFHTPLWAPSEESEFEKVIIPKKLYDEYGKAITVTNGNHRVFLPREKQIPSTPIGTLLHVPIRSFDQAVRKVILTVVAYRGYRKWGGENSFQYYDMLAKIARGRISEVDLRGYTLSFDKQNRETPQVTDDYLSNHGYQLTTFDQLNVATGGAIDFIAPQRAMGFERIIANALDHLESNIPDDVELTVKDGIIQIDEKALAARNLIEQNFINKRIMNLEFLLKAREQKIDELNAEISQNNEEIARYAASMSWRMTRPLRIVLGYLRNKMHVHKP